MTHALRGGERQMWLWYSRGSRVSPLDPLWTKVGCLLVSEGFCKRTSERIWCRSIGIEPEPSTACVFSWSMHLVETYVYILNLIAV